MNRVVVVTTLALFAGQGAFGGQRNSEAMVEQTFPLLQIGTRFFTNATVTSHTSNYVFVIHSQGMSNIKVAQLTEEERVRLGYPPLRKKAPSGLTNAVGWAKQRIADLDSPRMKELKRSWLALIPEKLRTPGTLPTIYLVAAAAVLFLLHLFFSFCTMCICRKAGSEPGIAVWLPVLQIFPMLRAAGMSPAWFLALLVPGLNLVAVILWCVKIVDARGKNSLILVALLCPVLNAFAFLYLAFSDGKPNKKAQGPTREIMTLEAA